MRPIKASENEDNILSGEFLEKKGLLRNALAKEAELAEKIPGYDLFDANITGFEKVGGYSTNCDAPLDASFNEPCVLGRRRCCVTRPRSTRG